mgnify:CR=1 FL=1
MENKNYDLSPLNEFFNTQMRSAEPANSLAKLMFNYASCTENTEQDVFRYDVGTLAQLYDVVIEIGTKAGEIPFKH